MENHKIKKWIIISVIFMLISAISVSFNFVLYKQKERITNSAAESLNWKWYELYRMSESINNAIENSYDLSSYSLYVNQTCYNFWTPTENAYALNQDMAQWLKLAYDIVFQDLITNADSNDRAERFEFFRNMNTKLLSLSKTVIDMDNKSRKNLLKNNSKEYRETLATLRDLPYDIRYRGAFFENFTYGNK